MAYTAWNVVFGEQPTAAKWNQLGQNDAGFRDGTNIDDNAILTRHLNNGAVTSSKIDFTTLGVGDEFIFTDQTTNSNTFTNLATTGPTVTVPVGPSGKVLVIWSLGMYSATTTDKYCGIQLSGANSSTPILNDALRRDGASFDGTQSRQKLFTGLNQGNTTFTMVYRTSGAITANFFQRRITVIAL